MDEDQPVVELDPPDGVENAQSAVEVLRAWIADGSLLVSLNSSAFGEHVGRFERVHHTARERDDGHVLAGARDARLADGQNEVLGFRHRPVRAVKDLSLIHI